MGIFSGLFKSKDKPQNRTSGSNYAFFMGGTTSGKAVTERSAMQMTAVYSCVRILSEAVAGLPLHLYKYTDSGGKAMALDHPLYHLLHDEPNPEMSSFVFRETLMTHLLLWGNAYAQIIRNGKGEVVALYPLMPNRMEVNRDKNGNQAWNAAKAFVETKRDKDGLLSEEDAKTYAQMEKKVQDYGAEIERMEAMSAMEAQLNRPTSSPITEKPMNGKSTADEKPKTGRASDAYRTGMLTALRSNFHQVSDVLREGVDADGGYLVPEEYDSRLIQTLSEENIMRKLGHTITTSGEHKINIAATAPAAAWIEEGGALSFGDATFAQILLDAHKLHVAIKVTEELLYDNAFKLEDYILTEFGNREENLRPLQ